MGNLFVLPPKSWTMLLYSFDIQRFECSSFEFLFLIYYYFLLLLLRYFLIVYFYLLQFLFLEFLGAVHEELTYDSPIHPK